MANTLTNLLPDAYEALDVISRELTGFIPAVNRNTDVARAAIGQTVYVPETQAESSANNTAAVTAPDIGDNTVTGIAVAITKSKHVPVRFNGEETKGLMNAGTFSTILADRLYQGMRTLVNEIETDLWTEAYTGASRAYGTAGTAPFGTAADMSDFAGVLRILEENGAPKNDLQLVLGHSAIGNLRAKQSGLFKVNEAGSSDMLRNGMTDRIMGMAIRHSDPITTHTKGTATGLDAAGGEPVGETSIALDGGDGGTLLSGDVVTFAGDTNKYVVNTGFTAVSGTAVIGGPGLVQTLADTVEMTIGNTFTANVAMARSALVLATRSPALPDGGDAASDITTIVDDRTGMAFELALYKQFLQNVIHIRVAWGFKAIKPAHIALLLG